MQIFYFQFYYLCLLFFLTSCIIVTLIDNIFIQLSLIRFLFILYTILHKLTIFKYFLVSIALYMVYFDILYFAY